MNESVTDISVEQELRRSYLDYAMSVIVGRALPDARDGLKPVHRRILFAMHVIGNDYNKPFKKSARIVGDVVGKYHPHGDSSVYDAIVRQVQIFSLRYPLIDGQGNFGSVDGDSAAAFRYTEVRMARIAHRILADIEKDTVDFIPNYDNSEAEPTVMPTRIPNLLINGSSGIAVGMATNIPPHNITEIMNACLALIDEPQQDILSLMAHISGPDFPTAGIINGRSGIIQAYKTGRGKIYVRARAHIEHDKSGKPSIIATELPYIVNKARLLEKIAFLVKEKKIEGVTAIRDESDQKGMRMVIELRKGDNAEVLLNKLYHLTQMQTVFGINMVALDGNQPRCMNLLELLELFIQHRREVVRRRTIFELAKARSRAHLLEGLAIALVNIDEIVRIIKQSKNPQEAKAALMSKQWSSKDFDFPYSDPKHCQPVDIEEEFGLCENNLYQLSSFQAQAILDMKLHRLTGMEQNKIVDEYLELVKKITDLLDILHDYIRLMSVIRAELVEVKDQFADERRTEIIDSYEELSDIDLIPLEAVVVTLSNDGYIKSQSLDLYQAQNRGGRGKGSGQMKTDDAVKALWMAQTHDYLLCFSNRGRMYWLRVFQLPMVSRQSKGRPFINYINLLEDEVITAVLAVREFTEDKSVVMVTQKGVIKKVLLSHFSRPRTNGIIAVDLNEGDCLVSSALVREDQAIMLFSSAGKSIRFPSCQLRAMGRTARGVRGMRLVEGVDIISMIVVGDESEKVVLTVSARGYGKCSNFDDYRLIKRGGQGVMAMNVTEKTGRLIAAALVDKKDDILLISTSGTIIRTSVLQIPTLRRSTQGVRVIQLSKKEELLSVRAAPSELDDMDDSEEGQELIDAVKNTEKDNE